MNSFVTVQNSPSPPIEQTPPPLPKKKYKRLIIVGLIVIALCGLITFDYFIRDGGISKYLSSWVNITAFLNQSTPTSQGISPQPQASIHSFQETSSTPIVEITPSPTITPLYSLPSLVPKASTFPTPSPFISIKDSITYYDIYGDEEGELKNEITLKGPVYDNIHYAANTAWNLRPIYTKRQDKNACIGQGTSVELTVTINLPRWNPPNSAPIVLVTTWNEYTEKLLLHENGHKTRAIDSAQDAFSKLNALPIYNQCWEYDEAIKNTNEDVKQKLRDKDKAYDDETRHGETQGADFY